jgi:diguanylate cyclase (GGDEF)-like protein
VPGGFRSNSVSAERKGQLIPKPPVDRFVDDLSEQELLRHSEQVKFPPALEDAYARQLALKNRQPALTIALVGLSLWVALIALDFYRVPLMGGDPWDAAIVVWVVSRLISLVLIAAMIVIIRLTDNNYTFVSGLCYLAIGVSAALTSNIARDKGIFVADAFQVLIVMCGFLPAGLVYRRALLAVLAVAGFSLLMMLIDFGSPHPERQLQLALTILVAVPAAAIGGYYRERADRTQFILTTVLERRALTDTLTNLPNRRLLVEHFQMARRQASRDANSIGIAVADIDFFKRYNDEYGHIEGDKVLRNIAEALRESVRRPLDIAVRFGGEEFVLLFYAVDQAGLNDRVGEALRRVRALKQPHRGSPFERLSISIGSTICDNEETLDEAIARADAALYDAKAAGRDCAKFHRKDGGQVVSIDEVRTASTRRPE